MRVCVCCTDSLQVDGVANRAMSMTGKERGGTHVNTGAAHRRASLSPGESLRLFLCREHRKCAGVYLRTDGKPSGSIKRHC